jgi:CMP-N,N'-diacetyllegionaminic acid synthase
MANQQSFLAIIPAKAKSLGLPGKNMRLLAGKPLIQHTIEAALSSGVFKNIVVVSDGKEILDVARGLNVLGVRTPDSIDSNGAGNIESVIEFALKVLEKNGYSGYDAFAMLNPTSPLRSAEDIKAAVRLFSEGSAISVVSVVQEVPIVMRRVRNAKRGYWHCPGLLSQKRTGRKPLLVQNGAIYITRLDFFREAHRLIGNRCYVYPMPAERSVDIDTFWDFVSAEAILKELDKASGSSAEFISGFAEAPKLEGEIGSVATSSAVS